MASEEDVYQPKDAIKESVKATMITGGAGLLVSAVQNSMARRNYGAWGVFTRTGSHIAMFAAMGGVYQFSKIASANLREKDDTWNTAIGGFLGGSVIGLRVRTFPALLGYSALASVVLSTFDYTGGVLSGYSQDPSVDEYQRKEDLRKNRRRPIQETIDELGEGRGIYGPGYGERRRERIKQAYGIEVPTGGT